MGCVAEVTRTMRSALRVRAAASRLGLVYPLAAALCLGEAIASESAPGGNLYHYCESPEWPAPIVKRPSTPIRQSGPSDIEVYDSIAQRVVRRDASDAMMCRQIRLTPEQLRALRAGATLRVEP